MRCQFMTRAGSVCKCSPLMYTCPMCVCPPCQAQAPLSKHLHSLLPACADAAVPCRFVRLWQA